MVLFLLEKLGLGDQGVFDIMSVIELFSGCNKLMDG